MHKRVLVNMLEGKCFVEYSRQFAEDLEGWLKTEGMHYDFCAHRMGNAGDKLQIAE